MTNKLIYEYGQKMAMLSDCNAKMPVRIGFYLQKNIQTIQKAVENIDKARLSIGERFGIPNETGTGYDIPPEKMSEVGKELNDLFNLDQEVNIHKFKIDDFSDIELTYQEMSAIMFMIEDDE